MTRRLDGPEPLGVTPSGGGVNVAVVSAHATAIEFCLFDGAREVRRVALRGRTGDVFHDHVPEVAPGARYGLRAHGPFLPREGHRFNAAKLLIDPYARELDGACALHPSQFAYRADAPADALSFDDTDSAAFVPKAIVPGRDVLAASPSMRTGWPETVLYELHVRGFTMRHDAIPEALRGRFAGLAHPAALEHLVRLGVTSVEVLPAAAWIDERHLVRLGLGNYWGYNPVALMAPDPRLAPGGWPEIRDAVAALAEAGIETIVDVVLNHSGEGDAQGPTVSLRGLDNATYYRLPDDAPWRYIDDTGCGNTLALDRPAPLRLAMDALRLWAAQGGVHGFRFDLAATMGRRPDGFDPAAPLLQAIGQDPLLRGLKLIAEPWDIGPGGWRTGAFPPQWGEWNDRFRDGVRRFWHGDADMRGELATRLAGSADLFAARHVASRSVNFVVAHDGFTLADLVSYETKRNMANGEDNRDGTDASFSWNNGAEGASDDAGVLAARRADQRALLATLLLARGTPMLAMGAEFGHSQHGNNNAYAQDNEVSWLDWSAADAGLLDWTRRLLAIRRDNPLLHGDTFLTGAPGADLLPDVAWHDAAGPLTAWNDDADTLAMVLTADDARVCVVLHRGRAAIPMVLPAPRGGWLWRLLADSGNPDGAARLLRDATITVPARGVLVLAEQPGGGAGMAAGADAALLGRLARAAGIAPAWWDVRGNRTQVGDDTIRALLAAMRLPAATQNEARDTLRGLADAQDRRALPAAVVTRGEPAVLTLGLPAGQQRRAQWLTVVKEDGSTERIRIGAEDGAVIEQAGIDGLPARVWQVPLPPLPVGRHVLRRDDAPDVPCHVTVAPPRCYLPPALAKGGRRFGIAAQLYALRRADDQGIGDLGTLALLTRAARRAGAATVGINPLHMLFPEQRDRASPYHPSDRRFLDPIYIDVPEAGPAPAGDLVDYPVVWAAKRAALRARFAALPPNEALALDRFIAAGGVALHRFAIFQAIAERHPGTPWPEWPAGLRAPDGAAVADFAREQAVAVRFHQYLQCLADRQLAAAGEGLELGLFRDLAVGAAADGAECWVAADNVACGAWIGAPPDPLAPNGQNWFLPPPIPGQRARDGFAAFAALLAANMRHAGILRIDHVMGLSRLFWIPDGASGADGAYVAYPFADLLGQVTLESVRAGCMVIGEDLGTVPDGLRDVLAAADLLSYRVLLLEREGRAFRPAAAYPRAALACVTTHDLPPLAGWLAGADIAERVALNLVPEGENAAAERAVDRGALATALGTEDGEPMAVAAHALVGASPAVLAMAQADDLAGARIGVNLPGTDTQRANWRRRLETPVETLLTDGPAPAILDALRAGRLAPDGDWADTGVNEPGTGQPGTGDRL